LKTTRKEQPAALPQKWAIRFAVEGDLRFLSHHDMMRAFERMLARADLPVRFSQGFNPRPVISLASPRPVGVASDDELLVVSMDQPLEAQELLDRLQPQAPKGMTFKSARELEGASAVPVRVSYRTPTPPQREPAVACRLAELRGATTWPIVRRTAKGRLEETRQLDLRAMIESIELKDHALLVTLVPHGQLWARPAEVLALVGLDGRGDLAATVRTRVECSPHRPQEDTHNSAG
jgi:radical SAM-linked protein